MVVVEVDLRGFVFGVVCKLCRLIDFCVSFTGFDEFESAIGDGVFGVGLFFAGCGFWRDGDIGAGFFIGVVFAHQLVVGQDGAVRGIFAEFAVFVDIEDAFVAFCSLGVVFAEVRHIGVVVHDVVVVGRRRKVIEICAIDFEGERVVERVFRILVRHVIPLTGIGDVLFEFVVFGFDGFGGSAFVFFVASFDEDGDGTLDVFGQGSRIAQRFCIEHDFVLITYDFEFTGVGGDELVIDEVGFVDFAVFLIETRQSFHHGIDFGIVGGETFEVFASVTGFCGIPHAIGFDEVFESFFAHIGASFIGAFIGFANDFFELRECFLWLAQVEVAPSHFVHGVGGGGAIGIDADDFLVLLKGGGHIFFDSEGVFGHAQESFG